MKTVNRELARVGAFVMKEVDDLTLTNAWLCVMVRDTGEVTQGIRRFPHKPSPQEIARALGFPQLVIDSCYSQPINPSSLFEVQS